MDAGSDREKVRLVFPAKMYRNCHEPMLSPGGHAACLEIQEDNDNEK